MRTSAHVLQEKQAGLWQLQGVCSGLLLLCVVVCEVWDAETKPIEFVCNKGMRRSMNIAAEMGSALVSSANALVHLSLSPCFLNFYRSHPHRLSHRATATSPWPSLCPFSCPATSSTSHRGKTNRYVHPMQLPELNLRRF